MQQIGRDFVEWCSINLPIKEPIIEIGSLQVSGEFGNLRSFFPDKKYVGCDINPGNGVDFLIDINQDPREVNNYNYLKLFKLIGSTPASCIISIDALEHIKNPIQAVSNMEYMLSFRGILI